MNKHHVAQAHEMVVARKPGEAPAANRINDVALKAALHLTRSSALWGGI